MPTSTDYYSPAQQLTLGLLPEGEGRRTSFIISSTVNAAILITLILVGMMAKQVIQKHYEMTELIVPSTPPPQHFKQPPPPKIKPIEQPKIEMQPRVKQIEMPKPRPEPKPVQQLQAKVNLPEMQKQQIRLAPQPKQALADAAPAQNNQVKPKVGQVHFGDTFGVMPNPNSTRPATVAAIGNPYGNNQGPVGAPQGRVGSTGLGTNTRAGSGYGVQGKVASAGIPGATGTGNSGPYGKVGSAGIPTTTAQVATPVRQTAAPDATGLEVLYKPAVQYTAEARQMRIEGDVVLRVTFLASGRVVVQNVVRGLGHGLDQEAQRVAQQIRFRPATRDGRPVDLTTTITISFQLA